MALFTIQNKFISATVNSYGAELVSLKTQNNNELLWQAKSEIWPRHAPVLFPIVGKLKENTYRYDSNDYALSQHGFARDKEFALVEESENSLCFELIDDTATYEIYPFHFSLIIAYALNDNALTVTYEVFNPDNKDLLFGIGAHPGFNCCQIQGETLEDYYLEFENTNQLIAEKLKDGLLSGNTYAVELQNQRLALSVNLFNNDAIVFKNKQIEKISLCSNKSNSRIELICTDWPYFGIWTKKGCDRFVCLEPWYGITDSIISDGTFEKKEGFIQLKSGEVFNSSFTLKAN